MPVRGRVSSRAPHVFALGVNATLHGRAAAGRGAEGRASRLGPSASGRSPPGSGREQGWSIGNWEAVTCGSRRSAWARGSPTGSASTASRRETCVRRAFEVGINFIDTANVYGRGAAESFLGEALAGATAGRTSSRRSSSSRCRGAIGAVARADPQADRRFAEAAAHRPRRPLPVPPLRRGHAARGDDGGAHRGRAPREGALHRLQRVVAGADPARRSTLPGVEPFVSSQPQYSMLWRRPEAEVIPLCAANGIGQIVWSPLAQGVLTGKYEPGEPPPPGLARREREHGRIHGRPASTTRCSRRSHGLRPIARGLGLVDGPARTRVGVARAQRGVRDHRRDPARAGGGQRRRRQG